MDTVISAILVDDHVLLRESLRLILEDDPASRVVAEAGNGADAVQLIRQCWPRVVVMDLAMPIMDGVRATEQILRFAPQTAVLILSLRADERDVERAFAAGAQGYLQKNAKNFDLNDAVRKVAQGASIRPPRATDWYARGAPKASDAPLDPHIHSRR